MQLTSQLQNQDSGCELNMVGYRQNFQNRLGENRKYQGTCHKGNYCLVEFCSELCLSMCVKCISHYEQ